MHQTTVRFGNELWRRIDDASTRIGVSAAQYIRDSTLIRLTTETATAATPGAEAQPRAVAAIDAAREITTESQAVWAQARLARERARDLRDRSRALAEKRASTRSAASEHPAASEWVQVTSTERS